MDENLKIPPLYQPFFLLKNLQEYTVSREEGYWVMVGGASVPRCPAEGQPSSLSINSRKRLGPADESVSPLEHPVCRHSPVAVSISESMNPGPG